MPQKNLINACLKSPNLSKQVFAVTFLFMNFHNLSIRFQVGQIGRQMHQLDVFSASPPSLSPPPRGCGRHRPKQERCSRRGVPPPDSVQKSADGRTVDGHTGSDHRVQALDIDRPENVDPFAPSGVGFHLEPPTPFYPAVRYGGGEFRMGGIPEVDSPLPSHPEVFSNEFLLLLPVRLSRHGGGFLEREAASAQQFRHPASGIPHAEFFPDMEDHRLRSGEYLFLEVRRQSF